MIVAPRPDGARALRDTRERSDAIAFVLDFRAAGASEAGGEKPISSLTAIQGRGIRAPASNSIPFLQLHLKGRFFYFYCLMTLLLETDSTKLWRSNEVPP